MNVSISYSNSDTGTADRPGDILFFLSLYFICVTMVYNTVNDGVSGIQCSPPPEILINFLLLPPLKSTKIPFKSWKRL